MKTINNHSTGCRLGDAGEIAGLIVVSFLSGNLWILISRTFFSRSRKLPWVSSSLGRTAIGLAWFALVMSVIYSFKFSGTLSFRHIVDTLFPAIVTGMTIQLIVFTVLNYFGDGQ